MFDEALAQADSVDRIRKKFT